MIKRAAKTTFWFLIIGGLLLGMAKNASAKHLEDHKTKDEGYYATVVGVAPNHVYVNTPVRTCHIEEVKVPKNRSDIGGADGIIGGIIGGVIGNQFGGGTGQTAMTALGAVVGNRMATAGKPEYDIVRQEVCNIVDKKSLQVLDYSVTLEYNGAYWNVTMKREPAIGARIRVRGLDIQD